MMKRAGRAVVVISVACAMLLTSCATAFVKRAPLRPVQLMGEEGTLVITVDAVSEAELVRLAFGGIEELGARSQRISLALSSERSTYPADLDDFSKWAVIEGDYPPVLVNTALMYVPGFSRHETEEGATWFSQKRGPLSLRAVGKGAILVTDGEWEETYRRYKDGPPSIDDETARKMEGAQIAIYAKRPKTFFDLGLDLPQSVFEQSEVVLMLLNGNGEGGYSADALIEMRSEKDASTLSQMVRSGYIATLRKEGKAVNIPLLRQMFLLEGTQLVIKGMDVPNEGLVELKRHLAGMI